MEHCVDVPVVLINKLSQVPGFQLPVYLQKFGSLKTNLERVNFAYNDLRRYDSFPAFRKDEKNDVVARVIRENGNLHFKSGQYRIALDHYTLSILTAETKELLALAYANRSAALFKLNFHAECLIDIERAFENGYPDNLRPKLLKRQKDSLQCRIEAMKPYEQLPKFPDSQKSSTIQCARNCILVEKNQQFGRHVVASRNIEIGEILSIEKPFTVKPIDDIYVYCHECLKLCYNPIPCKQCTQALYCSEQCRLKAFNTYHQYECPILLSLNNILDAPKKLALKVAFMIMINDLNKAFGGRQSEMYCSDQFDEIYNLEAHTGTRDNKNLFGRASIAAAVFHLIKKHTIFFQNEINEDVFKDMFLSLMLISEINCAYIYELSPKLAEIYEIVSIATGIYPFYSLFNHSCCSNVAEQYYGSTMVLRAIQTIKKGQQCFVDYRVHYTTHSKMFRQTWLTKCFYFSCTCKACNGDWPQYLKDNTIITNPCCCLRYLEYIAPLVKLSRSADVDDAKKELPHLLAKLKKWEQETIPMASSAFTRYALNLCYSVFGNKRRV